MRRLLLLALVLFALSSLAQDARTELNLGVQAFKNARYEEAIQHFRRSTQLDPSLLNARLYLATALAQQYIPGADTPENLAFGNEAITEYKHVLEQDPNNINSMKGIAYLYLQMKKFEDAKTYYTKASEADPADPENPYSIGVIEWTQCYQPRMQVRAQLNLGPTKTLINSPGCFEVREKILQHVENGMKQLTKALQLRPDYDDAMAYMNLMYRERADIQCGDAAANEKDLAAADNWVDLTMATKKRKAETQTVPNQQRP